MLESKTKAEMDQARAFLIEYYPNLWRGLYSGLIEEGFSERQSLRLLETYIYANCNAAGGEDG